MTVWLMVAAGFVVVAARAVTVRRYSPSHLVGELSLRGRGVFLTGRQTGSCGGCGSAGAAAPRHIRLIGVTRRPTPEYASRVARRAAAR